MKKYCLIRTENNLKSYFKGKLIRSYDNKFDYWEGNSLNNQMNNCTYNSYLEALKMKIECLFVAKKLYKICLV